MDGETAALFRQLLDLIAGECRRAGMLPQPWKPRPARRPAPHGTYRRYNQHRRDHERPCAACRAANVRRVQEQPSYNATERKPAAAGAYREIRNGLPDFRPYVYRGTGRDELTPWMDKAGAA